MILLNLFILKLSLYYYKNKWLEDLRDLFLNSLFLPEGLRLVTALVEEAVLGWGQVVLRRHGVGVAPLH